MNTNGRPQYTPEELKQKQAEWARGKAQEKKAIFVIAVSLGALLILLVILSVVGNAIEQATPTPTPEPGPIPINMDLDTFVTRFNSYKGLRDNDVGRLTNKDYGYFDSRYCASFTLGHGIIVRLELCDDSGEDIIDDLALFGWIDTDYNANQFVNAVAAANVALTGEDHMDEITESLDTAIDWGYLGATVSIDDYDVTIMPIQDDDSLPIDDTIMAVYIRMES